MKKCCQKTYRLAIEQVIFVIKSNRIVDVEHLLKALEYGVSVLKKKEKKKPPSKS
jgi:hypothetical protein